MQYIVENNGTKAIYTYEKKSKGIKITECRLSCSSAENHSELTTGSSKVSRFMNGTGAEEISVPDSVDGLPLISIGGGAFAGINVKRLILPSGKYKLCSESLARIRAEKLFWPKSLKDIPSRCFKCSAINEIEFEDVNAVESIGEEAFSYMHRLNSMVWPSRVRIIPTGCFTCSDITSIAGTENIIAISDHAFMESKISEFNFPNAKSIGRDAFRKCLNLSNVTLSKECNLLGPSCFQGCANLEEVTNTIQLKLIGDRAFEGTGLLKFVWPDKVKSVPSYCFMNSKLEEITNTAHIIAASEAAFFNTRIKDIELAPDFETITPALFSNTNIEKFKAPLGCTCFSSQSFMDCADLSEVIIEAVSPHILLSAFAWNRRSIDLYFPNAEEIQLLKEGLEDKTIKMHHIDEGCSIEIISNGKNEGYCFLNLHIPFDSEIILK